MSTAPTKADAHSDESELLARLKAGDPQAFESIVRAHGPRMLAVARRILGREQDAQDAVQEAFFSAHRSIDRFEGDCRIATWLYRIAVNAALMRRRAASRRPERSIEELLPTFQPDGHQVRSSSPWREPADVLLARKETAEFVRRKIEDLPENYRIVLILRDIEEIETEETARLLRLSPAAVKTRLHRARQALRELLDPHFRDERR
jgi:RNA polymerase sigma-70 factor (ECF subfamily)